MNALRLYKSVDNFEDVKSFVETLCNRFSKLSGRKIRPLIYYCITKNSITRQTSYSIAIYEDEAHPDTYKLLKEKFGNILTEKR